MVPKPRNYFYDLGGEFNSTKNREMYAKYGITGYPVTNPDLKAFSAERMIRTIRTKIARYLHYNDTDTYITIIPDIERSINGIVNRMTGLAPDQITVHNELEVVRNETRKGSQPKLQYARCKISVGSIVQHFVKRATFDKEATSQWSEERFTVISCALRDNIPLYKQQSNWDCRVVQGLYYPQEIQVISH